MYMCRSLTGFVHASIYQHLPTKTRSYPFFFFPPRFVGIRYRTTYAGLLTPVSLLPRLTSLSVLSFSCEATCTHRNKKVSFRSPTCESNPQRIMVINQ